MKTTFIYDHYFKYDELKEDLLFLEKTHPGVMRLEVNCVTKEGRNQYVAILGSAKKGMLDKPALYIDGNIHAGEVTSSMCAMHTIDYLVSNYDSDPGIQNILDEYTLYVIPRVSPDGAEVYLNSPASLRSVNRVHGDEKGGIKEKDLDEDGVIRMMRVKSDYGAWKKDSEDPSFMKPRDPSDTEGEFYDIYPEGVLEEYEGSENLKVRKDPWGLDFNRNFPYGWYPEPRQDGAGDYPLSNPETRAIVDFVLAHPNIGGAALGHTSGGIILYPPGTKPSADVPHSDIEILKTIAQMGKEELGYEPLNIFDAFIQSKESYDSGALDDWFYETKGIPSYTVEFWDVASKAGVKTKWGEDREEIGEQLNRFAAIMKWVKENAPEYYADWKSIEHPDFDGAELGGFNYKFTHQNPPEKFLLKEAENDTRFNIRFLKALPRLSIDCFRSEMIAEGLYRIEATIGNRGYLSTALSDLAIQNDYARPVIVRLEGAEILNGKEVNEIKELQGFSKTKTGVYYYGNITTEKNAEARKKLTWIVRAKKGDSIILKASQIKAGSIQRQLVL